MVPGGRLDEGRSVKVARFGQYVMGIAGRADEAPDISDSKGISHSTSSRDSVSPPTGILFWIFSNIKQS